MKRTGKIDRLWDLWHIYNRKFFGSKLVPPRVIRITRSRLYLGYLKHYDDFDTPCSIFISAHQSSLDMAGILLHEMIHQYQHSVLGIRNPDHGPTFRGMAKQIEKATRLMVRVKALS